MAPNYEHFSIFNKKIAYNFNFFDNLLLISLTLAEGSKNINYKISILL